jgi:uncharacterized protein YsxB (DUF464 family)
MTTVTLFSREDRLVGFEVTGHTGLAPAGTDILCAAVTSAVRLTECALNDILGLEASVKVREASVLLKLPAKLSPEQDTQCQTLLAAFLLHLTTLAEEHPQHLLVLNLEV